MHNIQRKIIDLLSREDLSGLSLREIARKIGEKGSPQKIKHHLNQLAERGLIKIHKRDGRIEKVKSGASAGSRFISLPILGSANCGEAAFFAADHVEGYLKVTKGILGELIKKVKDLFVLRAVGSSMNRASMRGSSIEDGDYVVVDKSAKAPQEGDYVVSIVDGVANIKKIFIDKKNEQVVLVSESNQNLPPIYVHQKDLDDYLLAGTVVRVLKQPDDLSDFLNASAADILKDLGPMSEEEHDYYEKLSSKKAA